MKFLLQILLISFALVLTINCTSISLFENMNKQGEQLDLKELANCTNLPMEWQDRTSSVNIHRTICVKVFEHSDCKGKYVTLRSALHSDSEYLDNLRELGFNDVISSVSPCALQIEPGQYVIQNLGDNKMMTLVRHGAFSVVASKYWKNLRSQHWEINQVAGSTILYELHPVGEKPHFEQPVVYDAKDLPRIPQYREEIPAFMLDAVDDWRYVIRDSRTKNCLATVKGENGAIKPTLCSPLSKNQQWVFRKL